MVRPCACAIGLLTREWPPEVYGGAGVHVEYLVRELRRLVDVEVHCLRRHPAAPTAHTPDPRLAGANPALQVLSTDLSWRRRPAAATSSTRTPGTPTWRATWRALLHGVPHVATTH